MFNKNKQHRQRFSTHTKIFIFCVAILLLLGLLAVYVLTGFSYTVARIRCGHNPIYHSTGFKEGDEYVMPSHPMYEYLAGTPFNKYYCTEKQAKEDGLRKKLSDTELEELRKQAENTSLLRNSPVSFPVYTPKVLPDGIIKEEIRTEDNEMVMQTLYKENGAKYGHIRQGKLGSESDKRYWLCNDKRYSCNELGRTSGNLTVYRTYYPGGNNTVWGVRTENTYITISIYGQQQAAGLNDRTVLSAFNTLQRVN